MLKSWRRVAVMPPISCLILVGSLAYASEPCWLSPGSVSQTSMSPWTEKPTGIELQSYLGGPLGNLGLALDRSWTPGFSTNLGVGWLAPSRSLQTALMLRIRLPFAEMAGGGAEAGLSIGGYDAKDRCKGPRCRHFTWSPAFWGRLGAFLELRTADDYVVRSSFGASSIFNADFGSCTNCSPWSVPETFTASSSYVTLAVGRVF